MWKTELLPNVMTWATPTIAGIDYTLFLAYMKINSFNALKDLRTFINNQHSNRISAEGTLQKHPHRSQKALLFGELGTRRR
jgi:hypothetical protein